MSSTVRFADIQHARETIRGEVRETPLIEKRFANSMSGYTHLLFKLENLQRSGSFKMRGAAYAVARACEEAARATPSRAPQSLVFVAASSGNHAQALARSAKARGARCVIVCPKTAPQSKLAAMAAAGAEIVLCEPTQKAREEGVASVMAKEGSAAVHIHPYSGEPNLWVHAGQGTLGIEIIEQVRRMRGIPIPSVVIVPVGGGGLISGVATAIKALSPQTLVVGAEPATADDAARSLASGKVEGHRGGNPPPTIADGMMTTLCETTLRTIQTTVDAIVTVSEEEIRLAMRLMLERAKHVIEPSAAVSTAVALFRRAELQQRFPGRDLSTAVSIVCGGNVDVDRISELVAVGGGGGASKL